MYDCNALQRINVAEHACVTHLHRRDGSEVLETLFS